MFVRSQSEPLQPKEISRAGVMLFCIHCLSSSRECEDHGRESFLRSNPHGGLLSEITAARGPNFSRFGPLLKPGS
jgi:hypothetical protein